MKEQTLSKKRTVNKARVLATGVVAFGLLFSQTAAHAAPLETAPNSFQKTAVSEVEPFAQQIALPVTASKDVKITFSSPLVTSTPAPEKVAPVVKVESEPVAEVATPVAAEETYVAPAPAVSNTQPVAYTAPANTQAQPASPAQGNPAPSAPVGSGKGSQIAAAAMSQLGVTQDCTALVSNSLRAVGINFHDWPAGYMSLGTVTSNPVPGDLIYYRDGGGGQAHIAVYIGNGQAVHGGWNGNQTAIFSVNVGSGPVYIHIA